MIFRMIWEYLYFPVSCCVGNCTELFLDCSQLSCLDVGPRFYHLCRFELRPCMNRVAKMSTEADKVRSAENMNVILLQHDIQ